MSSNVHRISPIHRIDDLDGNLQARDQALGPWVRQVAQPSARSPSMPVAEGQSRDITRAHANLAFSGDRAMLALQAELALRPDRVPVPPLEGTPGWWPLARWLSAIVGLALLIAWGIVALTATRRGEDSNVASDGSPMAIAPKQVKVVELRSTTGVPALVESTAPIQPPAVTAAPVPTPEAAPIGAAPNPIALAPGPSGQTPVPAPDSGAPNLATKSTLALAPSGPALATAPDPATPNPTIKPTVASIPSGPTPVTSPNAAAPNPTTKSAPPPSAPGGVTVRLAEEEVAMLVRRGKDFFNNGDVYAARLLLQRAAAAGSAEGALLLGNTFDPLVIHRMGVIGTGTDVALARSWYKKAAELGSPAATQQLDNLERDR